jgi:glyoxylase-like metal-dependent hydrolase (beta-lactamase superfamily II)
VKFHDGDVELAPGIELFRIGGHTGGLQVVRVNTVRGRLVLASDAFHFNENRLRRAPFPIVYSMEEMLAGFARCEELAAGDESLLVPGHDPAVVARWPRWKPDIADIVKLDAAPSDSARK